jgi:lactoylglutathione lyase
MRSALLSVNDTSLDACYAYGCEQALDNLLDLFLNDQIGIRAFVFNDPEGYQIEIQSATRPGA